MNGSKRMTKNKQRQIESSINHLYGITPILKEEIELLSNNDSSVHDSHETTFLLNTLNNIENYISQVEKLIKK